MHLQSRLIFACCYRYGGTEAAAFCCLTTLNKQMEYEKCVDIYLHAKLYHMRRPGIWKTQVYYYFVYVYHNFPSFNEGKIDPAVAVIFP